METQNTWLTEKGLAQIDFYLKSKDIILLERNRSVKLLIDIFQYYFDHKSNLHILDLGCGDGSLTDMIYQQFPNNRYYLLDGNQNMLDKAKEKLGHQHSYIKMTFEQYMADPISYNKYDFIFSSMAIHHLTHQNKLNLYSKLYYELKFSGLFINLDVVLPVSSVTEKIQFQLWIDWINETLSKNNFKDDIGKYDHLPDSYKNKEENKPSPLSTQLDMLNHLGFRNVELYYKYAIFCLFGASK